MKYTSKIFVCAAKKSMCNNSKCAFYKADYLKEFEYKVCFFYGFLHDSMCVHTWSRYLQWVTAMSIVFRIKEKERVSPNSWLVVYLYYIFSFSFFFKSTPVGYIPILLLCWVSKNKLTAIWALCWQHPTKQLLDSCFLLCCRIANWPKGVLTPLWEIWVPFVTSQCVHLQSCVFWNTLVEKSQTYTLNFSLLRTHVW